MSNNGCQLMESDVVDAVAEAARVAFHDHQSSRAYRTPHELYLLTVEREPRLKAQHMEQDDSHLFVVYTMTRTLLCLHSPR